MVRKSIFVFYVVLSLDIEHIRQSLDSGSFSFVMIITFPKLKHMLHVGCPHFNPEVLLTAGSSKVPGLHGPGAGFLIKGKAAFITSGPDFDLLKSKFDWLRATLAVTPDSVTQTW